MTSDENLQDLQNHQNLTSLQVVHAPWLHPLLLLRCAGGRGLLLLGASGLLGQGGVSGLWAQPAGDWLL